MFKTRFSVSSGHLVSLKYTSYFLKCLMVLCTLYVDITMANFFQYFSTKIHGWSAQVAHFMFKKRFSVSSRHLLSLKYSSYFLKCPMVICTLYLHYKIFDLKMSHGYMYAIRTYNHGKFFSNILAPKLIADELKWLILCLRRDSVLVCAICFF